MIQLILEYVDTCGSEPKTEKKYFSLLLFEQGYLNYYPKYNLKIWDMHTWDINAGNIVSDLLFRS